MRLTQHTMQALAVKVRIEDHLAALGVPRHSYGIKRDPNGWNVTILMGGRTLEYHVTSSRSGAQQLADLDHIKRNLTALGIIGGSDGNRDIESNLLRAPEEEAV